MYTFLGLMNSASKNPYAIINAPSRLKPPSSSELHFACRCHRVELILDITGFLYVKVSMGATRYGVLQECWYRGRKS